ncbi:MAG TPA: STAS domain-containing protein [Bacillus bacterium]|nr:STAS domain-containing protein [Bacillus sp. (in: firmicutes)]
MIQTLVWNNNLTLDNIENFKASIEKLLVMNIDGIILNLENVSYMNEQALGIIAKAAKEAQGMDKELVIINNQASMKKIFEMVQFDSIVQVFSKEQYAQKYVQKIFAKTRRKVV